MNSHQLKKMGFIFCFITFFLGSAQLLWSDEGKPEKAFDLKGSFRIRTEQDYKTDYLTERSLTPMRFRLDFNFHPEQDLQVFFQPQFSKSWGEPQYIGSGAAANKLTNSSGSTFDSSLSVHQAYASYQAEDWLNFVAGRQIFSYGNELILGALDWNNTGRSFDALKIKIKHDSCSLDIFASKIVDNNVSGSGDGDLDLYGIYHRWNTHQGSPQQAPNSTQGFDLYALYLRDAQGTTSNKNLWTFGARAEDSFLTHFDYRVELTQQLSNTAGINTPDYQADAEIGWTLEEENKLKLGVEGFVAGLNYNQLYPTGHKWLGYADLFSRRNISGFVANFSRNFEKNLNAKLDYHLFHRTNTGGTAYKLDGTTPLGSISASDSSSLGSEIDLTLKYTLSPSLSLSAGGSLFFPGAFLKDVYGEDKPWFGFAQVEMSF